MENILLDRSQAPAAAPLTKIPFPEVRSHQLDNGLTVYTVQFGSQNIVELDAVFPAGKSFESQSGVASFTARLMQEGTENYTGLEFARKLDQYGAFLSPETGYESATFNLTSLTKHLASTVPLMAELLLRPALPADELEIMKVRSVRNLEIEENKTAFIARKQFNQLLNGADHPYGRTTGAEDIRQLSLEALKAFHASHFALGNAFFLAVGRFDEAQLLDLLNQEFGAQAQIAGQVRIEPASSLAAVPPQGDATGLHYFEKEDSMQATVRVGHRGFARNHPDFYPMQVVNTVLGGYFGSRLMKNIREEKGYTYGIHAGWLSMRYNGVFLIQTDVGNQYIRSTLEEIRKELNLLIDKGIEAKELALVKNFMLGRSASGRETPSQIAGLLRTILVNEIEISELDDKFDLIQAVQPEDVQRFAQQYYHPEQLLEVVCGKMEDQ